MARTVKAGLNRRSAPPSEPVASKSPTKVVELPATEERLADFCRGLAGTTEDIKWWDHLVFSVRGKMFASFTLDQPGRLGFKCDDDDFDRLTAIPGVIPAPYAARFGWVAVERRGALPAAELRRLLRKSYDLVVVTLPARARLEIERMVGDGERAM